MRRQVGDVTSLLMEMQVAKTRESCAVAVEMKNGLFGEGHSGRGFHRNVKWFSGFNWSMKILQAQFIRT